MGKSKNFIFYCFIITLTFIFFILTMFLFSSCTTREEKDWYAIKNSDSVEVFLDFADNYKGGGRIVEANKKIHEKINSEEDTEKLLSYIEQYPDRADEFKERISEIALNAALEENTYESLEKYIGEFTGYCENTRYVNEAKTVLKNMYFNAAKNNNNNNNVELLEEFIDKYKNEDKIMSDQAADIIDEINWSEAENKATREAYADYIEKSKNMTYNYIGKHTEEAEKKLDDIDWKTAYDEYKSKDILLPVKEFADLHPNSSHISEAETIIKQMQEDSSYSDKYLSSPALDSIEEFLLYYPGHKDTKRAEDLKKNFIGDIYSMLKKGYIATAATGDSITRSRLIVENRADSKLIITVTLGTYLEANSGYVQNMLVRENTTFTIEAKQIKSVYINTACMNIFKDIPNNTNYFTVSMLKDDSPLLKLLKAAEANKSSYEVIQAAVWQINDNPGKDKIMNTIIYQDGQDVITEKVYSDALKLIETANK